MGHLWQNQELKNKLTADTGVVEETCVAVWAIMSYRMILKEQGIDLSPQNEAGEVTSGRARGKVQPCCSSRHRDPFLQLAGSVKELTLS